MARGQVEGEAELGCGSRWRMQMGIWKELGHAGDLLDGDSLEGGHGERNRVVAPVEDEVCSNQVAGDWRWSAPKSRRRRGAARRPLSGAEISISLSDENPGRWGEDHSEGRAWISAGASVQGIRRR